MNLVAALERTVERLASSEDSPWTPWSAAEVREELDAVLLAMRQGGRPDEATLRLLFAPTGPVQELSMANGWAEEMLRLAEVVDASMNRTP
jgi:hypothetical protein